MDIEEGHIAIIGIIATFNIALIAPLYKIFFGDHIHRSEMDNFRKEMIDYFTKISNQLSELEYRIGRVEGRLNIHVENSKR